MATINRSALILQRSNPSFSSTRSFTRVTRRRSSGTYYDSQSGRHVPIHDASKVSAFLAVREGNATVMTKHQIEVFAGFRCYNEIGERQWKTMDRLLQQQQGSDFLCFCDVPTTPPGAAEASPYLRYTLSLHKGPRDSNASSHSPTAISIAATEYYDGTLSPTDTANQVASWMDDDDHCAPSESSSSINGSQVGDSILLEPELCDQMLHQQQAEGMLELCEELSYIDMPGPTMHSRLVVATQCLYSSAEDGAIDDLLLMGINKFIVESPDQREWLQSRVEEQGKELV